MHVSIYVYVIIQIFRTVLAVIIYFLFVVKVYQFYASRMSTGQMRACRYMYVCMHVNMFVCSFT